MKISKIYKHFTIPLHLQMHMFKVAAVAWEIGENFREKVDIENVIAADLLHDMGNIIKFNFDILPECYEPEGREYWEKIQFEFGKKYSNENLAVIAIAEEIKVDKRVRDILQSVGALHTERILDFNDKALWIANYADYRVAPYGVVSLEQRLLDGRNRYVGNKGPKTISNALVIKIDKFSHELEKLVQDFTTINLQDISELTISDKIKALKDFNIPTHNENNRNL